MDDEIEGDDFFSTLLNFMNDKQDPWINMIKMAFPKVEERANISIKEYLEFNITPTEINHYANWQGKYYGECNQGKNNTLFAHGKGIRTLEDGRITLGYF